MLLIIGICSCLSQSTLFQLLKQLYSTADSLVKNYITPDSAKMSKQSNKCAKSINQTPYTLKLLKCLSNIFAYFAINICIVHMYIINIFVIGLSFTMLHEIVVLSLIKAIKLTFLYLCLFVWFYKYFLLKVCNVVIHLTAGWFGSLLILL